jgi:hypothetical protein
LTGWISSSSGWISSQRREAIIEIIESIETPSRNDGLSFLSHQKWKKKTLELSWHQRAVGNLIVTDCCSDVCCRINDGNKNKMNKNKKCNLLSAPMLLGRLLPDQ